MILLVDVSFGFHYSEQMHFYWVVEVDLVSVRLGLLTALAERSELLAVLQVADEQHVNSITQCIPFSLLSRDILFL